MFGFAGLWEYSAAHENTVTEWFCILTRPANDLMGGIEGRLGRMPAILRRDKRADD